MLGAILGVTIGLSFVYLLLGLITSWVQEMIVAFTGWRAKQLERIIRSMLDPSALQGEDKTQELAAGVKLLTERFYDQPIIASLTRASSPDKNRKPSYISARDFSTSLYQCIALNTSNAQEGFKAFKKGVGELPNSRTKELLEVFISQTEEQFSDAAQIVVDLRSRMESWFDKTMERASGWYKRNAQVWSCVIGFLLAIAFNASTFEVASTLWQDQPLRDHVYEEARSALDSADPAGDQIPAELFNQMSSLNLPIGWEEGNYPQDSGDTLRFVLDWVIHSLGILFTGLAVSLGAPFWFDLLSRFMNFRGAGGNGESEQSSG